MLDGSELFTDNKKIFQMIKEKSPSVPPIITFNGKIIARQRYVTYDEVQKLLGPQ